MEQHESEKLARLWTESQPVVASFILAIVPDFHQSEDVLQQVAVVLVREYERYDSSKPFLPWALGIARNVALKSRRDVARRSKHLVNDTLLDRIQLAFEEKDDSLLEMRKYLRQCLTKQPRKVLELLHHRYALDLSPAHVATNMGVTSGAVRAMLHRARQALRRCIKRAQGAVE
jgi:RNA polymerase sigma-70 factor (ECF subfamily)